MNILYKKWEFGHDDKWKLIIFDESFPKINKLFPFIQFLIGWYNKIGWKQLVVGNMIEGMHVLLIPNDEENNISPTDDDSLKQDCANELDELIKKTEWLAETHYIVQMFKQDDDDEFILRLEAGNKPIIN